MAAAQRLLEFDGTVNLLRLTFTGPTPLTAEEREELGRRIRNRRQGRSGLQPRHAHVAAGEGVAHTEKMLWEVRDLPGVAAVGPRLFLLSQFLRVSSAARPNELPVQAMGLEAENRNDLMKKSPTASRRCWPAGSSPPASAACCCWTSGRPTRIKVATGDTVNLPAVMVSGKLDRPAGTAKLIGVFADDISDAKNLGTARRPAARRAGVDAQARPDRPGGYRPVARPAAGGPRRTARTDQPDRRRPRRCR